MGMPLYQSFSAYFLIVLALFACNGKAQVSWWTTHALVKVRPTDVPLTTQISPMTLFAARNEFEPFQIVLRSESRDVEKMDVLATDLLGPSGASISSENIAVYLQRYIQLDKPSSVEGEPGEWPDPLLPRVDRYARERRNAFPFSLRQGRNQPLWIEVYAPPETTPGLYSGKLTITATDFPDIHVPFTLQVWNFTLPSTSSITNSFGLNGVSALKQHRGRYTSDQDLLDITFLYAKAALWHRVSIHGGTLAPPPFTGKGSGMRLDWSFYDQEIGPFLDGTVFRKDEPLFGAKATSVDLRTHIAADTDEKKMFYWRRWAEHFSQKGWTERLFHYTWDEPDIADYSKVANKAALAHRADARIRNLVTTSIHGSLRNYINIWAPLINCMVDTSGFADYCDRTVPRAGYDRELEQGKSLWWYQSCASHGCKVSKGEYFRGWPSYMVDVAPVANRIMPWLAWKYQIEGELYFSMNEAYAQPEDAWDNIYLFGGNGDGTLFYPGRPSQIGGKTDIPIESVRLKLIREGLEDYEYLVLVSRRGLPDQSDQAVCSIVTSANQWQSDPDRLYALRRNLGEILHANSPRSIVAMTGSAKDTGASECIVKY